MARVPNMEKWGRKTARERYADGGGIPQPEPKTISNYEAYNSREGWEQHPEGTRIPKGWEGARGRNELNSEGWGTKRGTDHGIQYMRPARENTPTSKRGGKVK